MDDPPDAGLLTSRVERGGSLAVYCAQRIPGTILERTCTVHHRVDTLEYRQPLRRAGCVGNVYCVVLHFDGSAAAPARDAAQLVPKAAEPSG
jgi:hypothetical protein